MIPLREQKPNTSGSEYVTIREIRTSKIDYLLLRRIMYKFSLLKLIILFVIGLGQVIDYKSVLKVIAFAYLS